MDLRSALRRQRNPGAPSSSLLLDFNQPTTQTPLYHSRSPLPRPAQTADHHLSGGDAQTTAATAAEKVVVHDGSKTSELITVVVLCDGSRWCFRFGSVPGVLDCSWCLGSNLVIMVNTGQTNPARCSVRSSSQHPRPPESFFLSSSFSLFGDFSILYSCVITRILIRNQC
ncbi:uncharacterized protein LOC110942086 isoform X2 [Helianthus annuus]|uniref:uncharacterized protein LOC110942086 isoform X2 n=1 Tax=Helianthus annuus TaxID=4232 RepID=UPI000B8FE41D|nr:uncharacterized protein LOC110942086 isoform X2 [Helianthus annuus]